jgi:hypothetical protein
MSNRVLSKREQAQLKKLLARYHYLGDEIYRFKEEREALAQEIVQFTCPFKIGDRVCVPRRNKFSTEPKGICEVVEIFAATHRYDIDDRLTQPVYLFRVKQVLKNGGLSQRTYTAHSPSVWQKVK